MSRRITSNIVDALTNAVIHHRFKKEKAALRKREHALALACYEMAYMAGDRAALEKLPAGWAATKTLINVSIAGRRYDMDLANPVPVPACDQHRPTVLIGAKAQRANLEARIMKWDEDLQSNVKEVRALRSTTRSTLLGFSTIKRLVETWPEMLPFIKANGYHEDEVKALAVVPAGLNKQLALPA